MPATPAIEALVLLQTDSPDPGPCLQSLYASGVEETTLVTERGRAAAAAVPERVRVVECGNGELCAAANARVGESGAGIVLTVAPQVRIAPQLPAAYCQAVAGPGSSLGFGTYRVQGTAEPSPPVGEPYADTHDLSEWSTTGYVSAVPRRAWLGCGGYDPSFRHAAEYDLRMRLGEFGRFVRVEEPLYDLDFPRDLGERAVWRAAAHRYFSPEAAQAPGFAYLMMEPAIDHEVRRAFAAALRRRGAWLGDDFEPLACPHDGARPLVTVIIATRNRANFIADAIASVTTGSFDDFEIVVVDNGSSDRTDRLLEQITREDPRVRVHPDRSEKSIATAHNLAVADANGKYISQLDSDDTYAPETLARQVGALQANPDWALAVSYYDTVNPRGELLTPPGVVSHLEFDRNTILRTSGAGAVRTWHRCAIERLGGFDAERCGYYAEDYDLVLRAVERWELGRVHEVLYHCCLHDGNNEKRLSIRERTKIKMQVRRRALQRRIGLAERNGKYAEPVV